MSGKSPFSPTWSTQNSNSRCHASAGGVRVNAEVAGLARVGPIHSQADSIMSLMRSPQTAVHLVTLLEEMPVQETIELIALLRKRLGRPPEAVLVNGLYPVFPGKPPSRRGAEPPSLSLWRDRRAVNERELARLAEAWTGTLAELPLLPLTRGPALLDRMVATMETALP